LRSAALQPVRLRSPRDVPLQARMLRGESSLLRPRRDAGSGEARIPDQAGAVQASRARVEAATRTTAPALNDHAVTRRCETSRFRSSGRPSGSLTESVATGLGLRSRG